MPLISFQCPMEHGCDMAPWSVDSRFRNGISQTQRAGSNGRPMYQQSPGGTPCVGVEGISTGCVSRSSLRVLGKIRRCSTFCTNLTPMDLCSACQCPDIRDRWSLIHWDGSSLLNSDGDTQWPGESAKPLSTSMSRGDRGAHSHSSIPFKVQQGEWTSMAFASSSNHMTPVFEVLAQNGRYFFDQKPSELPCHLSPAFRCALHHRRIASIRPALSTLNCRLHEDLGTGRAGCGGRPAKARSHRISETMARGAKRKSM